MRWCLRGCCSNGQGASLGASGFVWRLPHGYGLKVGSTHCMHVLRAAVRGPPIPLTDDQQIRLKERRVYLAWISLEDTSKRTISLTLPLLHARRPTCLVAIYITYALLRPTSDAICNANVLWNVAAHTYIPTFTSTTVLAFDILLRPEILFHIRNCSRHNWRKA